MKENLEEAQEQLVFNTLQDRYKEMIRPDVSKSDFMKRVVSQETVVGK